MLIVKKDFMLNTASGQHDFKAGDKIEGDLEQHWYVLAHSEPIEAPTPEPKPKKQKETQQEE